MNSVVMFSGCARCASNVESRTVNTHSRMSSSGVKGERMGVCVGGGVEWSEGWGRVKSGVE